MTQQSGDLHHFHVTRSAIDTVK